MENKDEFEKWLQEETNDNPPSGQWYSPGKVLAKYRALKTEVEAPLLSVDTKTGAVTPMMAKHYKCPKCHTRFTREYPHKPSDTKEVESLAELADRKNFYINASTRRPTPSKEWYISIAQKGVSQGIHFCEDGYRKTESAARKWLNSLPNKSESK